MIEPKEHDQNRPAYVGCRQCHDLMNEVRRLTAEVAELRAEIERLKNA